MTTVEVSSASGSVEIIAEDRADVVVERGKREERAGVVVVKSKSGDVTVRVPVGSDLLIGVGSGGVATHGRLGDVRVTTASGRVRVDEVTSLDVRSASGSVEVESCDGNCRIVVASGSMKVGRAGSLDATLKSGQLDAGPVDSAVVTVKSGRADISATGRGDIDVKSYSGWVHLTLPEGVHPCCEVELGSGRFECEPERGDDCKVTVRTMSGNVEVRTA